MIKLLILTLMLGIISSGASGILLQQKSANAQTIKIYENPLYGLRVPYPSDWVVDDTEEGEVLFAPQIGENLPSINIIVLPDPKSDLAALAENLKQLQESRGARIVDEEQSTINGREAYFLSWSGQDPFGGIYKNAAITTQTGDFIYSFSIGSNPIENFENMAAILNMMAQGAQFSESGSNSQAPNDNLGGEDGGITPNNTFQEGLGLQGRETGSGQNEDQFDPFGQDGDSLGSGDRGLGSGSESPDGLRPQNIGDDNNNVSSAGFETYTDARHGFSIHVPNGWDPVIPPPGSERDVIGVLSASDDPMYLSVGLDNSTDAKNLELQEYSDMYIDKIVNDSNDIGEFLIESVDKFPHSVGNADGYMVIYDTFLDLVNVTEKTAEAWTKLGNHGYIHFEFTASPSTVYEENEKLITQILESFQP